MIAKAIDMGDFWEVVYKEDEDNYTWETVPEIYSEEEAKEYAKEINEKQSLE